MTNNFTWGTIGSVDYHGVTFKRMELVSMAKNLSSLLSLMVILDDGESMAACS